VYRPEEAGRSKFASLFGQGDGVEALRTDVAIVGGGLGACAAALAAARLGRRVILTEETHWVGGQLTNQVVPPDEHPWIEQLSNASIALPASTFANLTARPLWRKGTAPVQPAEAGATPPKDYGIPCVFS
jgi:glycine/D-amino acid oxidase-like deaminating enzyme